MKSLEDTAGEGPSQDSNSGLLGQGQCYNHTISSREVLRKGEFPDPILQRKKFRLREMSPLPAPLCFMASLLQMYTYLWKETISARLQLAFSDSALEPNPKSLPVYGASTQLSNQEIKGPNNKAQ